MGNLVVVRRERLMHESGRSSRGVPDVQQVGKADGGVNQPAGGDIRVPVDDRRKCGVSEISVGSLDAVLAVRQFQHSVEDAVDGQRAVDGRTAVSCTRTKRRGTTTAAVGGLWTKVVHPGGCGVVDHHENM